MPTAETFRELGLFAVKNFFDESFCERIRAEIQTAKNDPNLIRDAAFDVYGESEPRFDQDIRRTKLLELSPAATAEARQKIIGVMPRAAEHFNLELKDCQKLKFAVYRIGDFFKRHADTTDFENVRQELKERKVSLVIFLNDESDTPQEGCYSGGNLTFYGLMQNPFFGNYGLPLIGQSGLLIAFPPDLVHEVTPVTYGERYVILTWFT